MKFLQKLIPPLRKKLSLVVIFVEYDRAKCGGSDRVFSTLQGYLANIRGCRITYLRVNNKDEGGEFRRTGRNIHTVGGDNSYREFSGWQKGLEAIGATGKSHDLILFVNDMFLKPGESFLRDYSDLTLLQRALQGKKIIGRIDATGQRYTVYNYDVSEWICTNCFLVPREAAVTLKDMVSIKENLSDFLPESFPGHQEHQRDFFKKTAPMNQAYKDWLVEWLTKRWHSRFEITEDTWELFRTKVRNILNESLLTARFAELGYPPERYGDRFYY